MFRLFLIFTGSFGASFFLLWATDGIAHTFFKNINSVMFPLGALFGALSFAFFNYVEGIIKDVPKKLKTQKPAAYALVIKSLTNLKNEVILNVILVIFLTIIGFISSSADAIIPPFELEVKKYWTWCILALHGACFLTTLAVITVQLTGFITANNLRAELSMNSD
ncbi:hypothetical protein PSCICE_05440 [Pseudomonas cichorii]|nr:hypothetical protein [Pseudomonas cichorii]GFM49277.1 hypothetical protein PSCICE_05440 [Pseudomonas cichorii]